LVVQVHQGGVVRDDEAVGVPELRVDVEGAREAWVDVGVGWRRETLGVEGEEGTCTCSSKNNQTEFTLPVASLFENFKP
jgi:hypothetical protein